MWTLLAAAALAQTQPAPSSDGWEDPSAPAEEAQDEANDALQDVLDQAMGEGPAADGDPVEATAVGPELPDPTWEALIERAPLTFSTQIEQPLVVGQDEATWAPGPDLVLLPDGSVYWGETKILDAYFGGPKLLFPPEGNPLGAKLTLSRAPADWDDLPENPGWTATGLIQESGSFARPIRAVERMPVITGDEAWEEPPVVISEETWAAYEAGRLLVVETPYDYEVPWVVRDGMGNPVDTRNFARMTEDEKAIELLEAEAKRARVTALSVAGGGVLLIGLSAIPIALIDRDLNRPDWERYESRVDRENYGSDEEYLDAIDIQRGLYISDLGDYRNASAGNTDMRWAAGVMAGTGVLALASAPWAIDGQREDREEVAETWSRERAERLIEDYNNMLKSSLGIPWDYDPGAVEDAPAVSEPEPEWTPDPRFQVQPQVAPGYVGVTVRF